MASFLPIRAFNRSQQVRIASQKIKTDTTAYIDISDPKTLRELQHHSALGAVYPVGELSTSNATAVFEGATVDEGSNAADMVVQINAGRLYTRDTGVTIVAVKAGTITITAADATNPRIDIIQVHTTTGAVTKVDGTAAASPVAPAASATNVVIARVSVPANDTAITTDQITDVAPRS
jgi:hypothetical protein